MSKKVDDYLKEGMYGKKEINPAERKMYLGTFRERVVLALTKGQVMKGKGEQALETKILENKEAKLLFNGNVGYRFFKPYKEIASKYNISYTTVKNREAKSDYGLILTHDHAVDIKDIHLIEEKEANKVQDKREKKSFFRSLFKK